MCPWKCIEVYKDLQYCGANLWKATADISTNYVLAAGIYDCCPGDLYEKCYISASHDSPFSNGASDVRTKFASLPAQDIY